MLSARAPKRGGKGDQSRLALLLPHLARRHEVLLVCGEPLAPADAVLGVEAISVSTRSLRRVPGVLATIASLPVQTSWLTPSQLWSVSTRLAAGCDVVLAVTPRSLRGPVAVPLVVDQMDSFSFNMRERSRGPEGSVRRAAARWEAARMLRWEQRLAAISSHRVVTSEGVRLLLPSGSPISVVPAAWDGEIAEDAADHVRDLDIVLSGGMRYPPNRQAAQRLLEEILPRVREQRPDVRAAIVGRDADDLGATTGVEIHSDVPDLHAFLRRAKVAVSPIRGAGSPFKVLEAAACGAAIVGTEWGLQAYGLSEVVAESPAQFATAIVRLLEDDAERARVAAAGREAARRHSAPAIAERFEQILRAAADAATVRP